MRERSAELPVQIGRRAHGARKRSFPAISRPTHCESTGTLLSVIPAFNHSHVLPPFEGDRLTSAHSSPYVVAAAEFVQRFAISATRCAIIDGFMRYRAELRSLGFLRGFQWLDGSFVEDVESREGRAPKDIDIVTFAHPPAGMSDEQVRDMMRSRADLFDQDLCKTAFRCDTAIVNLSTSPEWLVTQTRYWYGLYSHRRGDALWKGMLQLPLESNDLEGCQMLTNLNFEGESNAGSA